MISRRMQRATTPTVDEERVAIGRVLPLYLVVFVGFVGYSPMIAIFTPLLLRPDGGVLPRDDSLATRTIVLGIVLALYPLAQFFAAPGIGGLSNRFGRRRTLPFWATLVLLACVFALTALLFGETSTPRAGDAVPLTRAFASLADAFRAGRLRRLYLANFVLYLAVFGFFRVYPMYLVNRFHMTVSRESLFVAWVAVPIVAANAGIVSEAATPEEQGRALGSNQSLQVGAEALSGLGGGLLAAIADVLPLSAMAALAAVASVGYRRARRGYDDTADDGPRGLLRAAARRTPASDQSRARRSRRARRLAARADRALPNRAAAGAADLRP
jgi:MFS family permease